MPHNITEAKCVLVIGATAGIGRALALAIHNLPTEPTVIVAGRRQERIDELTKISDRIRGVQIDIACGRQALQTFVTDMIARFPSLDAVIFSAAVQRSFDFAQPGKVDLNLLEAEVATNYTAIVTMITSFLPHFLRLGEQGHPTFLVPISSGLAIIPSPKVPNYSASKAALHSFCLSLDAQLQGTNVSVVEILPPLVESELHDHQGLREVLSKIWMPIQEFTDKTMDALKQGDSQIPIGGAALAWEQFDKDKILKVQHAYKTFKQHVKQ